MSEEDIPDFEDMPTEATPISDFDQNGLLLKIAVKPDKARHLKQREIGLLADLAAPVPRGRQPPVNAAARVIEIIRARAVEAMPEEVGEDNNDVGFFSRAEAKT